MVPIPTSGEATPRRIQVQWNGVIRRRAAAAASAHEDRRPAPPALPSTPLARPTPLPAPSPVGLGARYPRQFPPPDHPERPAQASAAMVPNDSRHEVAAQPPRRQVSADDRGQFQTNAADGTSCIHSQFRRGDQREIWSADPGSLPTTHPSFSSVAGRITQGRGIWPMERKLVNGPSGRVGENRPAPKRACSTIRGGQSGGGQCATRPVESQRRGVRPVFGVVSQTGAVTA